MIVASIMPCIMRYDKEGTHLRACQLSDTTSKELSGSSHTL